MDIIFRIDNYAYRFFSKLGICFHYFSYRQIILRYVKRDSSCLHANKYSYPEKIEQCRKAWVFWAQGEECLPPILKQCYESVKRNCGDYEIIFVDMENVDDYVDIPVYIKEKVSKGKISLTHFSDFLRVALLNKWGGYWVDVTLFLSHPLPIQNRLFTIKQPVDNKYISRSQWSGYLWYMPKQHPLAHFLYDYLTLYWSCHDAVIDYLLIDYAIRVFYEKNPCFAKEIDDLPQSNPDHYFFQSCSCESPYSVAEWNRIAAHTFFFKTTWKKQYKEKCNGQLSFYGKLLNGEL